MKYLKIRVRIRFRSAGYIAIHRKLLTSTPFFFLRIMKLKKIGVERRFLSAVYIDIQKKFVNSTPFLDDKKYMKIGIKIPFLSAGHPVFSRIMKFAKIGVRIQFLSAGYIDIFKKLVNSTPFLEGNKIYENQGWNTIS